MTGTWSDRRSRRRWGTGRPVGAFLVVAIVALVALRTTAVAGIVAPRLLVTVDRVELDGLPYRRVVILNDAPTAVTVRAVRVAGEEVAAVPEASILIVSASGVDERTAGCPPTDPVPFEPTRLEAGDRLTVHVPHSVAMGADPAVEVSAAGPSGLSRTVEIGSSTGVPPACERDR